jgi:hypothetical protein
MREKCRNERIDGEREKKRENKKTNKSKQEGKNRLILRESLIETEKEGQQRET